MKPLSPLKYYWENKKKTILIVVILFMVVLAISTIQSMIASAYDSSETTTLKHLKAASFAYAPNGKDFIDGGTVDKIKNFESVKKVIPIDAYEESIYKSVVSNTETVFLFSENIEEIMKEGGLRLKDGRLPQKTEYEVVMHELILLNKGLKIGDEFGRDVNEDERIEGRYKIVGSLTGKFVLSFGIKHFGLETWKKQMEESKTESEIESILAQPRSLLVFPENSIESMNEELLTLDKTEVRLHTYDIRLRVLDDDISSVQDVLSIVLIIVIIAMGISVGAIIIIAYNDRKGEFAILSAIGYSKGDITKLICKEIGFLGLICTAVGYGLSMLLLSILDVAIFSPAGKALSLFTPLGLILTLVVPVMVFICSVLPVMRRLRKTDLIQVIEGK